MMEIESSQEKPPIARFYDSLAPFYTRMRDFGHRRDRDAKELLLEALSPFDNDSVLDIGTGPGVYAIAIAKRAGCSRVVGIDISETFVNIAKTRAGEADMNNVEFALGNIESLDFNDDSFTKIICAGVLSVVSQREQAIKELSRVLRPGGCLAVREPRRSQGLVSRYVGRLPEKSQARRMVRQAGLMFGHFSPDLMTESELVDLFAAGDFSQLQLAPSGRDIFITAIK